MVLTAYCLKTKQKDVPFEGRPTMTRTKTGGYMLKGQDANGNKMSAFISKEKADEALNLGLVITG